MKKKIGMKPMMFLFALVPLVSAVLILLLVTTNIMVQNLENNTKEELRVAARGLKEYYEYDLNNDRDLEDGFVEYEHDYIDAMKSTGVDLTLFQQNVRFITTIYGDNGQRIEGTEASASVWAEVSAGKDYYSDDVKINGVDYYVYYMPLVAGTEVVGMAFSGKPATDIAASERQVMMAILLIGFALIAIFAVIAILIAKKVSYPLKAVSDLLKELAEGNTNITVEVETKVAETQQIIDSTTLLSGMLKEAVTKIRTSTDSIGEAIGSTATMAVTASDATTQIAESMQALSQTTVTMASNVQDINDNVIQMGDICEQAVKSVHNLSENASAMAEANQDASECISNIVNSSAKSSQAVADIAERINSTNESISKINEMVTLITSIASQTNLLSLNASIEAARAGEAGRGFAVVAEEIKALAEQSDVSANQIKDIVSEIGTSSAECVKSAKDVQDIIKEEQELLETTKEKFAILDTDIKSSVDEINTVSSVTGNLSEIKETIMGAVTDLSAISEETSATNEEVAATIESVASNVEQVSNDTGTINQLSQDLLEAVAYFK